MAATMLPVLFPVPAPSLMTELAAVLLLLLLLLLAAASCRRPGREALRVRGRGGSAMLLVVLVMLPVALLVALLPVAPLPTWL